MPSGGIELNLALSSYLQKRQLDVELSVRSLCPKHLVVRLQSIVFHTFIFNNGAGFFSIHPLNSLPVLFRSEVRPEKVIFTFNKRIQCLLKL